VTGGTILLGMTRAMLPILAILRTHAIEAIGTHE
jgi:hypothetical protein